MSELTSIISNDEFEQKVKSSNGVVVVDIWAKWCNPCKTMLPIIESIQEEVGEKAAIYKLDADSNKDLMGELGIRSIPTLIFFKDGQEVKRLTGAKPKTEIISVIESL